MKNISKIFMMLLILLSMFFIISCGGDDSDSGDGMPEKEFYNKSKVATCEMAFQCDNQDYKDLIKVTDVSQCAAETATDTCTSNNGSGGMNMSYDGTKSQECLDCGKALSCDKFFNGIMPTAQSHCPSCVATCSFE